MKIIANKNKVFLEDIETFSSGAFADKTISVELSEDFIELTSFVTFNNKKVPIVDNQISTPELEKGICSIGVYGFTVDCEKLTLRLSPTPCEILVNQGTYNSNLKEELPPDESEYEKFYNLINQAIENGKLKGDKGDTGPQGPKGDKGDTGATGPQGVKGDKGADGKDALINGRNAIGIEQGDNITITDTETGIKISATGGGSGTGDYNDLTNKPAIDGNELSKDSTAESLGLAKKGDIPTKTSQLTNDSHFVTDTAILVKPLDLFDDIKTFKDIGTGTFIVTANGYINTSGGFRYLIGTGTEVIIVNVLKSGVPTLCATFQTGNSIFRIDDDYTENDTITAWLSYNNITTDIESEKNIRKVANAIQVREYVQSKLNDKADKKDIPTLTSQLTNDSDFVNQQYVDNRSVKVVRLI